MKSFNYNYTCPIIDGRLNKINDKVENKIKSIIEELSPYIPEDIIGKLTKQWTDELMDDIQYDIEEVRDTNIDMRKAAEKQIQELVDENWSLENEIMELKEIVDHLETV